MIKKMTSVLALAALVSTSAYAVPDRTGKTDISINVSGAIPDDSDSDSAAYVGGSLSHGFSEWLALGVSAGWAGFEETEGAVEIDENAFPIFGDIILRVPNESQAQLYGIVGLGAIVWDVDDNVANVDADIDTSFAAKFGGGVDWFVNDNWIVNFEVSYVVSDAEATVINTTTGASISEEGETDFWMIGGGLKYLFS